MGLHALVCLFLPAKHCIVIAFPNAKINIGLRITAKRDDGYHDIESIFYPIPLCDALEIVPAEKFLFTTSGLAIDGNPENNLCVKAYHMMRNDFAAIEPVHMHLRKQIPMGAGLGGGSADGAFAIRMLNDFFQLSLEATAMESYAARLGSDCPFFIRNQPALVSGRGEVMKSHPLDLSGWYLALISPEVHVSTAEAYSGVEPAVAHVNWNTISAKNVSGWLSAGVHNQFENHILPAHPEIAAAKELLTRAGAHYASMTGSGSSVYGLFQQKPESLGDKVIIIKFGG